MDWMSPGMRLRPLAARDLPVNRFPCYDVSSRFLSIFPVVRIPTQFSSEPTVYLSLVSSSMVFYPYEPCKKTATWDSQKAFMWRCWFAIYVCGFGSGVHGYRDGQEPVDGAFLFFFCLVFKEGPTCPAWPGSRGSPRARSEFVSTSCLIVFFSLQTKKPTTIGYISLSLQRSDGTTSARL